MHVKKHDGMEIDMRQFQSRAELKNRAKDLLIGKYGNASLMLLLRGMLTMFLLSIILSFDMQVAALFQTFAGSVEHPLATVISQLISLLSSILLNVFNVGILYFFLNIACGQTFSAFNLFYGFQQDFGKSFLISAVLVILNKICLLPREIMMELFLKNGSLNTAQVSKLLIAFVIGLLIYIPLSLGLSQCYFLMLDFPQYGTAKIIKLSFRIMKGQKCRLFLLQLSFLPLIILSAASFGLGLLWLSPYMSMAYTLFFLDIMKSHEVPNRSEIR